MKHGTRNKSIPKTTKSSKHLSFGDYSPSKICLRLLPLLLRVINFFFDIRLNCPSRKLGYSTPINAQVQTILSLSSSLLSSPHNDFEGKHRA